MKQYVLFVVLFFSLTFYAQDTLSVIRHTENDAVVPKDLKLVYRGIRNELFIDVPNSKSFTVIGDGVTKSSKNIYKVNPKSGKEFTISIDITLKNNKKITERHTFEIRNVAVVSAYINGRSGEIAMNSNQIKGAVISAKVPDRNLDFKFEIIGFSLFVPGDRTFEVDGNKIDEGVFSKLKRIKSGTQMFISNVKFRSIDSAGSGILFCKITPVIINIR